jgi:hypothetical protein
VCLYRTRLLAILIRVLHKVNNSIERPARIASVRVVGATQTRSSFLSSLVTPYLSPTPTSLKSILDATRGMSHILNESGLFRKLDARLEKSRSPWARDQDYDIVFGVKERGRFWANTSTEVGNGEGSAVSFYTVFCDLKLGDNERLNRAQQSASIMHSAVPKLSKSTSLRARKQNVLSMPPCPLP